MPTYKRNVILENIHTSLESITTAGGYSVTVRLVTRKFFQFDQAPEYPCCVIVAEGSTFRHADTTERVESELRFSILGYIKSYGDVGKSWDLATAVDDFACDIIKALNANLRRGSLAYVDFTEIQSFEPYYDWDSNTGIAIISGRVQYLFDKDEP